MTRRNTSTGEMKPGTVPAWDVTITVSRTYHNVRINAPDAALAIADAERLISHDEITHNTEITTEVHARPAEDSA